jgi:hypothetical protein
MTLTQQEIEIVVTELQRRLDDATLLDLHQVDEHTVILVFVTPIGKTNLLICTRPHFSRIHVTSKPIPQEVLFGAFVEKVRAFLPAKVTKLGMRFHDRVVSIGLATKTPYSLLFECSGHHPNLFLLDENDVILELLKPSRSHKRNLKVGRRYEKPLKHFGERLEALRFLPSGLGVSSQIEAYYDRLNVAQVEGEEESRRRRELRIAVQRESRLLQALFDDLKEQEEAQRRLEEGDLPIAETERLKRLAGRIPYTKERIARLKKRLERLEGQLRTQHEDYDSEDLEV